MNDWDPTFDWSIYINHSEIEVYKMTISGYDEIQGAIALENREDHVFVHLIESAPHNRFSKVFDYVGEHLIAFACKRSIELGHDGYIAFQAKTRLVPYYEKNMDAQHIKSGYMIITDSVARKLIMLYLQ